MTLTIWLSLVAVCCIGAMSPGPSLAVVLRHTISNGRAHGIVAAITHAIGIAVWAMLTIWGLALLVTETPLFYTLITYAGAGYLAWMGVKAIRSKGSAKLNIDKDTAPLMVAARDGVLISLLNPKLAVFFIALFSQFVSADLTIVEQLIMTATVASIDSIWYIIVALALSHSNVIDKLQRQSATIDKISGIVLVGLALRVVTL
ncbi:LysE family translocator [Motiliproteus sp. MSK22-1]|uniref:LysE family translocator n=1 Tax=Motiliproteus sp. MSK22-1 TaxID=1897630 RepID=UPI000976DA07|nr:LysE family translocator [Motiliproteus sp. MSK22-1]OMH39512.1 lysine transporter LysE [Motiliproteus sp. MSK22-1]